MKFSFKKSPGAKKVSADKQGMREQMLRTMPDELLAHVRGGLLLDCCHSNCGHI